MERQWKDRSIVSASAFVVVVAACATSAQPQIWPPITPLSETRTFLSSASTGVDTPFVAQIRDAMGVSLYQLECHNGNYEGDSPISFSGDFQCGLFVVKGSAVLLENLLAADTRDEQSTDWWNRGRLRAAQLLGECSAYPEYSASRHFRLRGMLIEFRFTDIEWESANSVGTPSRLGAFTFRLDVTADDSANSSASEVPTAPQPPESCYP